MNFLRPLQQALDYTPAELTAQLYTPKNHPVPSSEKHLFRAVRQVKNQL